MSETPVPKPDMIRPEYEPQKSPQPLARNFEKRVQQLDIITASPTNTQIAQLGARFQENDLDDSQDFDQAARNAFENAKDLIQDRKAADKAVKQARREAFWAPTGEFRAKAEALKAAEKRRSDFNDQLRFFADEFKAAGVTVEPSQQPTTFGDKIGQKAYEARWQMAAGGHKVNEVAQAGAGLLIEGARAGLRNLLGLGRNGVSEAQRVGQARLDNLKTAALSGKKQTGETWGKFTQMLRGARERVTSEVRGIWEAGSVWVNQRRQEIAANIGKLNQDVDQMMVNARASAATRLEEFNKSMKSVGEDAKGKWDNVSKSVSTFVSEQTTRVADVGTRVVNRVREEINISLEKARIFVAPAWESIQRDREMVREQRSVMMEKMGIMVEGVSDIAGPIIDRILDEGRDVRDNAVGLGAKGIEGLRAVGRGIGGTITETASPAWNFVTERFESLGLRANESRKRLNTFLQAHLGGVGNRFKSLSESTQARAKRSALFVAGVTREGGKILYNGVEVSKEMAHWFVQSGTAAKEFLLLGKEKIGDGIDMLQRYWKIYAAGKWKEANLSDLDIKRRMKLLRGAGAASLARVGHGAGRAASLGLAAGLETASVLKDNPKAVALGLSGVGVAALAFALATNPELHSALQSFLSDISHHGLPDIVGQIQAHLGGLDHSAVSPAGAVVPPIDSGLTTGAGLPTDILTQATGGVGVTPGITEVLQSATTSGGEVANFLSQLNPGQPLEAQARQLAGGVNETYYGILEAGFEQFKSNFLTTAQYIVDHASRYTPQEVQTAQQQLQAAARLNNDPTLIQGSQSWYDTLMRAAHYWRPV